MTLLSKLREDTYKPRTSLEKIGEKGINTALSLAERTFDVIRYLRERFSQTNEKKD